MKRLGFKPYFQVEVVEPDTVFLLTEHSHQIITGQLYKHLAPLLNGQFSLEEIVTQLAGTVSPIDLVHAIDQLKRKGYLTDGASEVLPETAAFWHSLGVDAQTALDYLARSSVTITTVGTADANPLVAALSELSIRVADEGQLNIVLTDDYLQPALAELNRAALASGRPWLLARVTGATLWIGPLFEPGQTACWTCMAQRIQGNRQVDSYLMYKTRRKTPFNTARPALPATINLGAQMVATEASKWLVQGRNPQLHDQLVTVHLIATSIQKHRVMRRPQCVDCGDALYLAAYRAPKAIELVSSPKKMISDGGYRTQRPDETFAKYAQHISPITGVISSLLDVSGDQGGMTYSYAAGHNFAMVPDDLTYLRTNMRSRSGGKGMTDIQARVSAIGEAIERFSGVYRGEEEVTRHASYRELAPQAIDLREVLLFSGTQHANRDAWNAQLHVSYHRVPKAFDEDAEVSWTPLWSLTHQEFKYLPTTYCYYGSPHSHSFCVPDSNGCASGNTMEEAILQGFLELVERDSVAIWWYNRIKRPAVAVESFGIGDYYQKLQDYYQSLNRTLWVLDLTTDLGISTFAAISARSGHSPEDIIVGYGAHLSPEIALLRAISELNQFLPMVMYTVTDGNTRYPINEPDTVEWFKTATLANRSYLVPDDHMPSKTMADYTSLSKADLRDDVNTCVAIVRAKGLETLVLDQTRADVGMPVCRVVVPGLRHFWRRLGPGRLYDVPVQLGWLEKPTSEADLNPVSMFF